MSRLPVTFLSNAYQHAARPLGFRIAATARRIDAVRNSTVRVTRQDPRQDPLTKHASLRHLGEASNLLEPVEVQQLEPYHSSDSPMSVDSPEIPLSELFNE